METLTNIAMIGLPILGVIVVGVLWLGRSVVKDVSLNDIPASDARVAETRRVADGLGFQLAIAEELGVDAGTLNTLKGQLDLAEDNAERARQNAEQRQEVPVTVPVFGMRPVAAFHQVQPDAEESDENRRN